jgi:hypothetical protein
VKLKRNFEWSLAEDEQLELRNAWRAAKHSRRLRERSEIITPSKPLSPPLRGIPPNDGAAEPAITRMRPEIVDSGCTIFDACGQCGRRVFRPHVANGRAYCGQCCPACARADAI